MNPEEKVLQAFGNRFGKEPQHLVCAPGRVNLLGEHVDYNDGFVLPAAINLSVWVAFSPAEGKCSNIFAFDLDEGVTLSASGILNRADHSGLPLPEWALYPAGVAWVLDKAGLETPPVNAVFLSNIPHGSGLSSSAAIEMAFTLVWSVLGGWSLPAMQRALLGQKAENLYVGVNCGIMDQFASACGEANRLLLLDCRSLEWQSLPIPEDISIIVADTGVRRKLTSGAYNDRRQACEEAVKILSADLPGIKALRDIALEEFNQFSHKLPALVEKRARHVVEEIKRTQKAVPYLNEGNMEAFGELLNICHKSLRDLYEVSIPELDIMTVEAQKLPGCYGARLTGAGFGGCTVNLVEKDKEITFSEKLALDYFQQTGLKTKIYTCSASDGARLIF